MPVTLVELSEFDQSRIERENQSEFDNSGLVSDSEFQDPTDNLTE
jgi:hypothetical protein